MYVNKGTILVSDPSGVTQGDVGSWGCIWSENAYLSLAGYGVTIKTGGNDDRVSRITVPPTGNVGIGTLDPKFELEVNGTGKADKWIDSQGFDLGKIGEALLAIHENVESVDSLERLKNLLKNLLSDLRDAIPPETAPPQSSSEIYPYPGPSR